MATATKPASSPTRLKVLYKEQYAKELQKELQLSNIHEVPVLEKIVVNVGLGKAKDDKRAMEVATNTLRKITGQQPIQTTARMSIASFKLREGNKIGLKVTLEHPLGGISSAHPAPYALHGFVLVILQRVLDCFHSGWCL